MPVLWSNLHQIQMVVRGHPVGVEQMGIVSIGEIFGVVGRSRCSDMSFSNFRKPFSKISSFSSVLAPLAWESARVCSNATKWSSSELGACCCAGFMAKGRTKGGFWMEEFSGTSMGWSWTKQLFRLIWSRMELVLFKGSYSDVRATGSWT